LQSVPNFAVICSPEQALIYDTDQMLSIGERMRNQEPILELYGEERAL
jgi:hypothetical protein